MQDSFDRLTTAGLGSALVGGKYTSGYRPAAVTVSSGDARIATMAPGHGYSALLPGAVATNEDFLLTFALPALPAYGHGVTFAQVLRHAAGGAQYDAKVRVSPTGAMFLSFSQRVGTASERFIGNEVAVPGTVTANERITFEAAVGGTTDVHLVSRVWAAGHAVPAFQAAQTDSGAQSLTKPGSYGFSVYVSRVTNPLAADITQISGWDATPPATTPPATKPPVTTPPVTTPPVTTPPVTTPPVTKPPVTTPPPVTKPPVTKPPVTTPPPTTPPPAKPPTAPPVTAAVGNLHSILAAAPAAGTVSLGAGTYSFNDFSDSNTMGIDLKAHNLQGAGSAKTTLEMTTDSSSKAGIVPTALWSTNPLYLLSTLSGSPVLGGFTLLGTNQGHLYNGLRIGQTTNAKISDVKVSSVPGNNSSPPGETFGINDWRTTGSVYKDIEIDGRNNAAAGFGVNSSSNITIDGLYSHDNKFSAGITYWQTDSGTLTDYVSANNKKGINFEQDTGTFNIVRPNITGSLEGADISVFSNIASNKITITDPILAPGQKLKIRPYIGAVAYGAVNKQVRSDIKVIVNGVDETNQLVQWV